MVKRNVWDKNADERHKQLLSGVDISFSKMIAPLLINEVRVLAKKDRLRILEVGCGSGVLTKKLLPFSKAILGIDTSEHSIAIAKGYISNNRATFLAGPIQELSSQKFNLIISNMSFQVIHDLAKLLAHCNKHLMANGKLIFSIPHPVFWPIYKKLDKNYLYTKEKEFQMDFTISNDRSPLPSRIPYIHRSIGHYSEQLYKAGFVIAKILEPFPSFKIQRELKRAWTFPHAMVLICKKT